jgi:hypothetical protein
MCNHTSCRKLTQHCFTVTTEKLNSESRKNMTTLTNLGVWACAKSRSGLVGPTERRNLKSGSLIKKIPGLFQPSQSLKLFELKLGMIVESTGKTRLQRRNKQTPRNWQKLLVNLKVIWKMQLRSSRPRAKSGRS